MKRVKVHAFPKKKYKLGSTAWVMTNNIPTRYYVSEVKDMLKLGDTEFPLVKTYYSITKVGGYSNDAITYVHPTKLHRTKKALLDAFVEKHLGGPNA